LIKIGLMTGDGMTVTGKTLGQNCEEWMAKHGSKWEGQDVIRPLENPIKATGHIRYVFRFTMKNLAEQQNSSR
jgi:dihydroxy-acid dehydratase